jgi:hypothetical protein
MGIISSTVLSHGGSVTGIVPAAMLRAGGEGDPATGGHIDLVEEGNKKVRLFHHADVGPLSANLKLHTISLKFRSTP